MAFVKGKSGNPEGRRIRSEDEKKLIAAARQHTDEAVKVIVEVLRKSRSNRDKLKAAEMLLDRGWGKPRQEVNMTDDEGNMVLPVVRVEFVSPGKDT